jgi:hypothetical protein
MSRLMIRPALHPNHRRTARKVSRDSSTPRSTSNSTPVSLRTRDSTSSEFSASRTADVAKAISSSQPELSAILANSSMVEINFSAPRLVILPELSMDSESRSVAFVELIGVGCPPRWASTTSRWTVLLPTSSTPNRTGNNLAGAATRGAVRPVVVVRVSPR